MTEVLTQEAPNIIESTHISKPRGTSFTKMISMSGILMVSVLPIGIIPRFMQAQDLNESHEKFETHVPVVTITHPSAAPANKSLNLPGSIEAIVETPVYARTNGYVRERLVDIGDRVHAGQLLAKIETPEIEDSEKEAQAQLFTNQAAQAQSEANRERARADLNKAIAELSQAQANVVEQESEEKFALSTNVRYKTLGIEGAVSAQDVDEKETRYKSSQAARNAAQERVNAAKSEITAARARLKAEEANVNVSAANVSAARARSDRSATERSFQNVTSPFAGVITERNIDQGTLISSGSDNSKLALYKLARIDTVKVFVDVPQYASSGVHVGQTVNVSLKEFSNKQYKGTVARTAVALDPNARTLRTEIHIPNSDLTLAPGMYADVNFSVPRPRGIVQIPNNSLILRSDGPQVITVKSGKTHYRAVRLGDDLGKQVEIIGGLNKSDAIVVNPADTLTEGEAVSVSQ